MTEPESLGSLRTNTVEDRADSDDEEEKDKCETDYVYATNSFMENAKSIQMRTRVFDKTKLTRKLVEGINMMKRKESLQESPMIPERAWS